MQRRAQLADLLLVRGGSGRGFFRKSVWEPTSVARGQPHRFQWCPRRLPSPSPVSSALTILLLLLTRPEAVTAAECACNHASPKICCGQKTDRGLDHCVQGAGRQCPADEPTCTDYLLNHHMGTCTGSPGDECEAGMIGT